LASAYLHDIGMLVFSDEIEHEIAEELGQENTINTQQQIRDLHHLRSAAYIIHHFSELRIDDVHQARIIARICRGHRKENLFDKELFSADQFFGSIQINVPLLAALLRTSDDLDITSERAPIIVYENVPPKDEISKEEWRTHLSISGVGHLLEDALIIKCSASCKDLKIHRALKRLETKINTELRDLRDHLHYYRAYARELPFRFEMDITPDGYLVYEFKFTLQEAAIMKLFMGERLYRSPHESIRELIKNSLDSCRYKKKINPNYYPKIEVRLAKDNSEFIIEDNGCGMDTYIFENYFAKIGQSFYQSHDFFEKGVEFSPVSELGIGILSCFMIGEKIVVETKAENNDSLKIEIDDVSDYFAVSKGTRKDDGTQVTVELKKEAQKIDFYQAVRTYARHLEIPIIMRTNEGELTIEDVGYQPLIAIPRQDPRFAHLKIENESIEGIVGLLFRDTEIEALAVQQRSLYRGTTNVHFISYEGVFVNNGKLLPIWLGSEQGDTNSDLNLKHHSVDLNVARNELVENHKLVRIRDILESELIQLVHEHLGNLKESHSDVSSKFYEISNGFIEALINLGALPGEQICRISSLYRDFYYFKCPSKTGLKRMLSGDIVDAEKPVVVFLTVPHMISSAFTPSSERYAIVDTPFLFDLMRKCDGFKEDELYVLPNLGNFQSFNDSRFSTLLNNLFSDCAYKNFLDYFDIEKGEQLGRALPDSWIICKFHNYDSDRFYEFECEGLKYLNEKNRFIKLLAENHQKLNPQPRKLFDVLVRAFFESFEAAMRDGKVSDIIQQNQVPILDIFVSAGIIARDSVASYLIQASDYPLNF